MGLDDDEEGNEEDEWRALLEKGWKKATGSAEEPAAEPAAEPLAEVAEAEAIAEEAAEAPEEPAEEAAAPDAEEEAPEEAQAEAAKPAALFGDFEISDEEDDGTLEADEVGEAAEEGDAGAAEEPVAERPAAPPSVAKAPVAKRPPIAKLQPLAKLPSVAKVAPAARPLVVKAFVAKRPPGAAPGAVGAQVRPQQPQGAFRPPLAFARPQQPGAQPQRPGARPQVPGARPQQSGARPQQQGVQPQAARPQVVQQARPQVVQQRPAWAAAAKGAGKASGTIQAAIQAARPVGPLAASKGSGKASVGGQNAVLAKAVAVANAKAAARQVAGAAAGGDAAGSATEAPEATVALTRQELVKQAHERALKKLAKLELSEEKRKAKLPMVRKAILQKLLDQQQQSADWPGTATSTAAAAGAAAATAKLMGKKLWGRSAAQAKATGAASSSQQLKHQNQPWVGKGKGAGGKGADGKGAGGKRADGKGAAGKGGAVANGKGGKHQDGVKKAASWENSYDYSESSWGVKRKASSSSNGQIGEQKSKKQKSNEWGEEADADPTNVLANTDSEGRRFDFKHVVVNMANVGATFSKKVMGKKDGDRLFDWEGVRRCVRHLKCEKKLKVIGVIHENFRGPDNQCPRQVTMPDDITRMCESVEETPRLTGKCHSSADDEMTIKCAYRRNCRFLDNDNYRDWLQQLRDAKMRAWLNKVQDLLHMRYYFDKGLGSFDVLEGNVPEYMLAQGIDVDKRELWTAKRSNYK